MTDLNGDGKPDLVVGSIYQKGIYDVNTMHTYYFPYGRVTVLLGNGNGTFQGEQKIAAGLPPPVGAFPVVADFNGDGKPDLATISPTGAVEILLG